MNFDHFFTEVESRSLEIKFDSEKNSNDLKLSNEALFHLRLISLTVLLFASDRRKPKTSELGQLVGECFERTFSGFKGSSQKLDWSANLRIRTVKALSYLEMIEMVDVKSGKEEITITQKGGRFKKLVMSQENELSEALLRLQRNYKNIKVESQMRLELS